MSWFWPPGRVLQKEKNVENAARKTAPATANCMVFLAAFPSFFFPFAKLSPGAKTVTFSIGLGAIELLHNVLLYLTERGGMWIENFLGYPEFMKFT
jgi:hypothetical protein